MSEGIILNVPTPLLPKRVMGNPFGTTDYAWCRHCRMEVDTNNEVGNRAGRYVFRQYCQRCGQVLAFGAFEVAHVGGPSRMLAMREWCCAPTRARDRR